jgi:UDP-N-acetylglucosamine 2-epimerase (non-hydrolysing)
MACAITAKKRCLPVAHLEAGLRSRDMTMPEEINRVITDAISDLLWTPSPDADENLAREGNPGEKIVRVGNIMIDSYEMMREKIEAAGTAKRYGLAGTDYCVVTLHRPVNVDNEETLKQIVRKLLTISRRLKLIFPLHPRTRKQLETFGLLETLTNAPGMKVIDPLGYIEFMGLIVESRCVLTDSGGIQEETSYLGIPCLTLRENTERPVTLSLGTNRLANKNNIGEVFAGIINGRRRTKTSIPLWDGKTARRCCDSLREHVVG